MIGRPEPEAVPPSHVARSIFSSPHRDLGRHYFPLARDPRPVDFRVGDVVLQTRTNHMWVKASTRRWEDLGHVLKGHGASFADDSV